MSYKVECSRCFGGKGFIRAYSHIQAGVCFKCGGKGYTEVKTNPEKLKAAKAKRDAKRQEEYAEREAKGIQRFNDLKNRYSNDPRIGTLCMERCVKSDNYAFAVWEALEDCDKKGIEPGINITKY